VKTCILTVKSTRSAKYSGEPNPKPKGDNGDNTVRNKHYAGMWQQLIHHTLNAWDDFLPDLEPIKCDADIEKVMFKYVEIFRPLPSHMQTDFAHQNFYNRFKMELGGDPILFPAEPNQFSAVVDKVMVGTTADAHSRRRSHESRLHPLRVASLTGKPSKESCAGPIRHQFAIDNPQLL